MKNYEIMCILMPSSDQAEIEKEIGALTKILTTNGATITGTNTENWGMRDLAYEIKKQTKGYYFVITLKSEPKAIDEFNRITKLDPKVLRTLVTVAPKL